MHGALSVALALAAASSVLAQTIVPKRFIVELASVSDVSKFYRNARTAKARPFDRVRTHVNVSSDIFIGTRMRRARAEPVLTRCRHIVHPD